MNLFKLYVNKNNKCANLVLYISEIQILALELDLIKVILIYFKYIYKIFQNLIISI